MKSTINDVAKYAGVSIKTVSRVINKEPSVRQNTRDKVMEAVKELNYQPNLAARNLAGTKAYSIAYVYDNPNAYYIIDMQNGILNECRKHGFELLIHPCNAKSERIEEEITSMIRQSRVAGLVLTPPFSEMPGFVQKMLDQDINVVRIVSGSSAPDDLSPCVLVNDHDTAFDITEHLIKLGHKSIGFIAGGFEHKSTHERLQGYKDALSKHDLSFDESLVFKGEYSFETGVNGVKALCEGNTRPSAIFSCNDEIAAGALFSARLMNISVPEQLSLAGFEDSPFSRQTWPKLTTAHQPNQDIAQLATSILVGQIRKQESSDESRLFTPELIVRESTASPN